MSAKIKITVFDERGDNTHLYIIENKCLPIELEDIVKAKTQWKIQNLRFKGDIMKPNLTLEQNGVGNNDIVTADFICELKYEPYINSMKAIESLDRIPESFYLNPDAFRTLFNVNKPLLNKLSTVHPLLADALNSYDKNLLKDVLQNYMNQYHNKIIAEHNTVTQKNIEENIKQKNIAENFNNAMEFAPELFVTVDMLYVMCEINGYEIAAFIDSGAQKTIISKRYAEKIGLMRLVDSRFKGIAQGVGTAKIFGRIHMAHIKIGKTVLNCSLNVIDQNSIDLLLGLDMMKRHLMEIDLKKGVLRIKGDETKFLNTKEVEDVKKILQKNKDIESLMNLGFDEKTAIQALKDSNNDLSKAIIDLNSKSTK